MAYCRDYILGHDRPLCNLLKPFDIQVIAYDPYASNELAMELNVELCSLDEIFQRSHVVSLHTPWLPETEGMITGRHFSLMKKYATFINTARGAVVREDEMIEVLRTRQDLQAVLDVTWQNLLTLILHYILYLI